MDEQYSRSYWLDEDVDFTKRPDLSVPQDGRLKSDGTPVRRCDGCVIPGGQLGSPHIWMLMEEFPQKPVPGTPGRASLLYCYFCNDVPKPAKKPAKAGKFSQYSAYVDEMVRIKGELLRIRNAYEDQRNALLDEKEKVEHEYRASVRGNR